MAEPVSYEVNSEGNLVVKAGPNKDSHADPVTNKPSKLDIEDYIYILPLYMRDDEKYNKLIEGRELSDGQIKLALLFALDDFNSSPPMIGNFGFTNFPSPVLLLKGAAINALDMAIFGKNRNKLPYNDSGLSVDDDGQAPMYMQHKQMLQQEYEMKKRQVKIAMNVEGCYGGSPSEYSLIYPYTNRNLR